MSFEHIPVMSREVIDYLSVNKGGIYLDLTLGLGGHAIEILKSDPDVKLIGIDIDSEALSIAGERLKNYKDRIHIVHGNFADLDLILSENGISKVDKILADLGVSSIQLDKAERGFSFRLESNLDMRMDQSAGRPISYELNNESFDNLVKIIREFGEERWARRIAKNIVIEREKSPITTTKQLADLIVKSVPRSNEDIHPATRTFQALRIYKNNELDNLKIGLDKAIKALKIGGRICVISFHSLEDRIVKDMFRTLEKGCVCPPKTPKCVCGKKSIIKVITKKPLTPSEEEIKLNPRSRSAKMRVAEKTQD
ncbi:TPA: 16S rRNA (cytosine(1402)-N(4))-methyltransferase RsmH [Candidatus Poribacteria bacterium]|nr:16S rRNA (cytosine(1402)-N(4))-methyltransferase RsmH [Candidatus Poribacteria bacterium]